MVLQTDSKIDSFLRAGRRYKITFHYVNYTAVICVKTKQTQKS